MRRVAITGLGAVTPLGLDAGSTWEAAVAGRSGVDWIQAFDPSGFPVRIAAEVKGFDPASVVPVKVARRLERNVLLGVETLSIPRADDEDRVLFADIGHGFSRITLRFGYMEDHDVPRSTPGGGKTGTAQEWPGERRDDQCQRDQPHRQERPVVNPPAPDRGVWDLAHEHQ